MRNLIIYLLLACLILPACKNEITGPSEALTLDSNATVKSKPETDLACDILKDINAFYAGIDEVEADVMLWELKNLKDQINKGVTLNWESFYINNLKIAPALVTKILNYDDQQLKLLKYELDNPESDGLLYQTYTSDNCVTDAIPCWLLGQVIIYGAFQAANLCDDCFHNDQNCQECADLSADVHFALEYLHENC